MAHANFVLGLGLGCCLLAAGPAAAQTEPPTPQQLLQQNDASIQNSANALNRSMTQQQIGQIEQEQRRRELFSATRQVVPPPAPVPRPEPVKPAQPAQP